MEDKLAEILKKGKIESEEEHDIVFEEWSKKFYGDANVDEMMPIQRLLNDWEDEQNREE